MKYLVLGLSRCEYSQSRLLVACSTLPLNPVSTPRNRCTSLQSSRIDKSRLIFLIAGAEWTSIYERG